MNLKMRGNNAKIIQAGVTGSTVVIENCDFYNTNYGTSNVGSTPVIAVSGSVKVYVLNCTFINPDRENSEDYWIIYNLGKLTVNNTNFINITNGAIYSAKPSKRISESLDINNCTFINVSCRAIQSNTINLNNSSFINCNGGSGGAVYIDKGSYSSKINSFITEPVTPAMTVKVTDTTIDVTLPKDATGNVLVDVNGQGYYAPVKDGKASVNVIGLDEGTYPATVTYTGDDKYANATKSDSVTVPKKEDPTPDPVDSNAKVGIGEDAVNVELPKDATGYVLVDVDGKGYYAPVKDGKATVELPELAAGNHTVTVTYTGDGKYKSANANSTVEVPEDVPEKTVMTEDLTKVEKGSGSFVANFTDAEGNPLANTKVSFTINGATYSRTTDAKGQATFAVNLVAGTYTMVTTNPVTNESATNTITVLPRFTEDSDLVKYFRNDSQYILKVLDDDGNPAKAGEIVTYNINGVFYNRTVNATGHVKLSINLPSDTYIITAEYKGCKVSHTVKVLPTLTGSDITKKYGQAGAYEAKLVDGQGKAYANQQIEFNINGVLYKRTTNADGVAKLNINLQAGKYIITASYGQARISNTVTVTA